MGLSRQEMIDMITAGQTVSYGGRVLSSIADVPINPTYGLAGAASAAVPAKLPSNRIALIGDSFVGQERAQVQASGQEVPVDRGPFRLANIMLHNRWKPVSIIGKGGYSAGDLLKDPVEGTNWWTETAKYKPSHVFASVGINGIVTKGYTADREFADLKTGMDAMLAAGSIVMPCLLPGSRSIASSSVANEWARFNRLLTRYGEDTPGVLPLDIYKETLRWDYTYPWNRTPVDSLNPPPAYFTFDVIHLAAYGAVTAGKRLRDILSPMTIRARAAPYFQADSANLVRGGGFSASGGSHLFPAQSSGAVGAFWNLSSVSPATSVSTIIARTDGYPGQWQQVQITGGANGITKLYQPITSGFSPGQSVEAEIEFEMSNDFANGLVGISFWLEFKDSGNAVIRTEYALSHDMAFNMTVPMEAGLITGGPWVIPPLTTRMDLVLQVQTTQGTFRATNASVRLAAA